MWSMLGTRKVHVLEGEYQRDRLKWDDHARLGGKYVRYWIWDAIKDMPEGEQVRITVEVVRGEE